MAQLNIALDRSSEMPLGTQFAWQLRALIASGRLAEGERLPGVREMAGLAAVNVNTVRTVYGRLADEGLIVSEHGRGTFVGERSRARDELARLAEETAGTARAAGIDPKDLALALYAEPGSRTAGGPTRAAAAGAPPRAAEGPSREPAPDPREPGRATSEDPRAASAEARRRATLRAEIALLERELAAVETANGVGEPVLGGRPTPQLLTAAELETIRDALVERLQPLRADRTVVRDERERERHAPVEAPRRHRAIATSAPRFESGAGGWSLRWRS